MKMNSLCLFLSGVQILQVDVALWFSKDAISLSDRSKFKLNSHFLLLGHWAMQTFVAFRSFDHWSISAWCVPLEILPSAFVHFEVRLAHILWEAWVPFLVVRSSSSFLSGRCYLYFGMPWPGHPVLGRFLWFIKECLQKVRIS
jgi:hypothetical protein